LPRPGPARRVPVARRAHGGRPPQVYQLPASGGSGGGGGAAVADLLDALEAAGPGLGIGHLAVSGPTLEEVFLAAAAHADVGEDGAAADAGCVVSRAAPGAAASATGLTGPGGKDAAAPGRPAHAVLANGAAPLAGLAGGALDGPSVAAQGAGASAHGGASGVVARGADAEGPGPSGRLEGLLEGAEAEGRREVAAGLGTRLHGGEQPPAAAVAGRAQLERAGEPPWRDSGAQAAGATGESGAAPETAPDGVAAAARAHCAHADSDPQGSGGVELQTLAGPAGLAPDLALQTAAATEGATPDAPRQNTTGHEPRGESAAPPVASRPAAGGGPGERRGGEAEWTAVSLEDAGADAAACNPSGALLGAAGDDGAGTQSGECGRWRRRRRGRRWWVAFREMIRKRAITAGVQQRPCTGLLSLPSCVPSCQCVGALLLPFISAQCHPCLSYCMGEPASRALECAAGFASVLRCLRPRAHSACLACIERGVCWCGTTAAPAARAGRDVRGALLTLLLPVAAVAAVLSVLKLNIDPTAPQLLLQLPELGQAGPLMLANPPEALAACITTHHRGAATRGAWDRGSGVLGPAGGVCAGALAFAEQASAGSAPLDSWEVSELLLREVYAGARRAPLIRVTCLGYVWVYQSCRTRTWQ